MDGGCPSREDVANQDRSERSGEKKETTQGSHGSMLLCCACGGDELALLAAGRDASQNSWLRLRKHRRWHAGSCSQSRRAPLGTVEASPPPHTGLLPVFRRGPP